MQQEKKSKVKKGYMVVKVGLEEEDGGDQRFVIPISYLYHPQFHQLLEAAHETYGYSTSGPLQLPCSVDDFLHLRWLIEKEPEKSKGGSGNWGRHHRHGFPCAR